MFRQLPGMIVFSLFAMVLAASAQAPVLKPSFDCAKATGRAGLLICGNEGLARLDVQEAALLRRARATVTDPAAIDAEQDLWLSQRNACSTIPCIDQAYRRRMQDLHRWVN